VCPANGYFKAKHAFFRFTWDDAQRGLYLRPGPLFQDQLFHSQTITKTQHYGPAYNIAELFGYRLWSATSSRHSRKQAAQIVRRDVTPGFIVAELIAWLNERKIVRPGYTTLQTVITRRCPLSAGVWRPPRRRAGRCGAEGARATADARRHLVGVGGAQQDAKNFRWRQMANEREKRARLEPCI